MTCSPLLKVAILQVLQKTAAFQNYFQQVSANSTPEINKHSKNKSTPVFLSFISKYRVIAMHAMKAATSPPSLPTINIFFQHACFGIMYTMYIVYKNLCFTIQTMIIGIFTYFIPVSNTLISANRPSHPALPVHHSVYRLSLSLTNTPCWGSSDKPSSPV